MQLKEAVICTLQDPYPTSLASFGGTFITGGQPGRKACCLPTDEDTLFEEEFLNGGDLFRRCSFQELADDPSLQEPSMDDVEVEEMSFAECLLVAGRMRPVQVSAAVKVMLEEPQLFLVLYRSAAELEESENRRDQEKAQRIFRLVAYLLAVVRQQCGMTKEGLQRHLRMRRDEESKVSVLRTLAEFARQEVRQQHDHFTAKNMMLQLGFSNVFERSLY
jgi:hypothetical protein